MKKTLLLLMLISIGAKAQSNLKTNIKVAYNKPNAISGKDTSIVYGKINNVNWSEDFSILLVNYSYVDTTGITIKSSLYRLEGSQITTLYNSIKNTLPETNDYIVMQKYIYFSAFRIIMAQTFGLNPSQITINIE